ncbi:hypothetical protein [Halorussus sp. AFM4]|uniref:hypothetical protein n=1 Tax=Halorussus sp. AFM4 TaxID=3421651 RepID=UPI003EB77078
MSADNQHPPNGQPVPGDEEHDSITDEHRAAQESGEVFESEVLYPIERNPNEGLRL